MARRILLVVGACAALAFALLRIRRSFLTVEVAGDSMLPTLQPGEFLVVRRGLPRRPGGCIAYVHAEDGRPLLKRIVGLPGESLRVGDHVEVNGNVLVEEYTQGRSPSADYRAVNRLEAGHYFLLGDNRAASTDSRQFGPVRRSSIEGVAWLRYWPHRRFGRLARPPRRFAASSVAAPDRTADPERGPILLHDEERFGTTS